MYIQSCCLIKAFIWKENSDIIGGSVLLKAWFFNNANFYFRMQSWEYHRYAWAIQEISCFSTWFLQENLWCPLDWILMVHNLTLPPPKKKGWQFCYLPLKFSCVFIKTLQYISMLNTCSVCILFFFTLSIMVQKDAPSGFGQICVPPPLWFWPKLVPPPHTHILYHIYSVLLHVWAEWLCPEVMWPGTKDYFLNVHSNLNRH